MLYEIFVFVTGIPFKAGHIGKNAHTDSVYAILYMSSGVGEHVFDVIMLIDDIH